MAKYLNIYRKNRKYPTVADYTHRQAKAVCNQAFKLWRESSKDNANGL